MSSVFLSHSSKDKRWVRAFAERLTADGVVVWLDEAELNIGDSLIEKIAYGIEKMDFVAAVISENSVASNWVQKELSLAMNKEINGRRVTVLPLLISDCTIPESLRDKLYADFRSPDSFEREYSKLLRTLGITKQTRPVPKQAVTKPVEKESLTESEKKGEDIRIVGVVKEQIRQDRQYSGLFDVYLQLSAYPPDGWEQCFLKAREFPRHSMWREAWVEGDCIVVKCALDEIERYHLRDLKEDVATANQQLKQARIRQLEAEERRRKKAEEEKEKRDTILDRLKFD